MKPEKCWFVVTWGPDPCNIDGPFGDDEQAAVDYLRRKLADPDTPADAGGTFVVELQHVMTVGPDNVVKEA